MVYRIFVEKKPGLDNEAKGLLNEAKHLLGIESLENIDSKEAALEKLTEAQKQDKTFAGCFAIENMPAQYRPAWESASQWIRIVLPGVPEDAGKRQMLPSMPDYPFRQEHLPYRMCRPSRPAPTRTPLHHHSN